MKTKENSVFDVTKIILAIMVVCIHAQIFPNILYPWLRIAVPIFFMISSYFFFSKINKLDKESEKQQCLKKYVNRNLKLYIFWFIILLPATIIIRNYFIEKNIVLGILKMLKGFAFSSTFKASWYIMAGIIGTTIIYNISKKIKNKTLFIITLIIYVLICFRSSYMFIFNNYRIINVLCESYEKIFMHSYTSFPVSLFWITCGKCFADKTIDIKKERNIAYLIISAACLYIEWLIIYKISKEVANDCYIFLAPTSIMIFNIIKNIKPFSIKYSKELRNISTVIYAVHATIISSTVVLSKYIKLLKSPYVTFIFTVIVCIIIYFIIKKLEDKKRLSFLKYSY